MECVVVVFWHVLILDKVECTSKEANREASLPPVAWLADRLVLCLHPFSTSLLSHSYWTGHRDWDLGMRCNMSYNMILCLATSLCSSLLSHSYWIVDIRIGLLVSSFLFNGSRSNMLDMRQPIGANVVYGKVLRATLIQPLSVGSAKACATKAIWKAALKNIHNNYQSLLWIFIEKYSL